MRHALLSLILSACYVTGHTPAERRDACIANLVETIAGSVVLAAGVAAQRDYDRNEDAEPPENLGALVVLTGGAALALPGAVGMALTCGG